MHGIDVERAPGLVDELNTWRPKTDNLITLISAAETLCQLRTGSTQLLHDVGSGGHALAKTIDSALNRLLAHRSEVASAFDGLIPAGGLGGTSHIDGLGNTDRAFVNERLATEAQELLDRIAANEARGHEPDQADLDELAQIFELAIADEEAATNALGLALRGVPASGALSLGSASRIDATFTMVQHEMEAGRTPQDRGIAPVLFPPGYRRWHDIRADQSALRELLMMNHTPALVVTLTDNERQQLDVLQASLRSLRIPSGLGHEASVQTSGRMSPFAAMTTIAAWHGDIASSWLGGQFSTEVHRLDEQPLRHLAELVASDEHVAVSFFNSLGTNGTVALPQRVMDHGFAADVSTLTHLSQGLALASHHDSLLFSGADLIRADVDRGSGIAAAEVLLLVENFDSSFLVDAAVESLASREAPGTASAAGNESFGPDDPRSVVLEAVAINGLGANLVRALTSSDQLDLLLSTSYELGHPLLTSALPPAHLVLAQAGLDPATALALISTVATGDGPFDDIGVTNGLSAALSASITTFAASTSLQKQFLLAYDRILASGAGFDVGGAAWEKLVRSFEEILNDGGEVTPPHELAAFVGDIYDHIYAAHHNNAEVRDAAVANANRLINVLAGSAGVGATAASTAGLALAGPVGIAIGLIAIGLAIWGGPTSEQEQQSLRSEIRELRGLAAIVRREVLLAAFGSGRVVTTDGNPAALVTLSGPAAQDSGRPVSIIDSVTKEVLFEGDLALEHDGNVIPLDRFDDFDYVHDRVTGETTRLSYIVARIVDIDGTILNRLDDERS